MRTTNDMYNTRQGSPKLPMIEKLQTTAHCAAQTRQRHRKNWYRGPNCYPRTDKKLRPNSGVTERSALFGVALSQTRVPVAFPSIRIELFRMLLPFECGRTTE
jgi:hypothetical protein